MPKRNTMSEVLDALSPADLDAANRKAAALANIPDPIWNPAIAWDDAYASREFNVRDDASYGFDVNKGLYNSLLTNGLEKRGDPMSFSREIGGRCKVLVGNLRHAMMAEIRRAESKRRAENGEPAAHDTLPFATIFGLVYTNLTMEQEQAIMADHIGRKDLNDFERCKEIGEFLELNGLTDAQGETRFGMNKNKVRRYRMRWAMPSVMAEYRKEKAGAGSTEAYLTIGQKALEGLYSAYTIDRKAGNGHRQEGPAFRAAFALLKSDPTLFAVPSAKASGPATLPRTDLVNQISASVGGFGDTPEIVAICETLRFASGDSVNLNEVRETIKAYCDGLRTTVTSLTTERDTLSATVTSLTTERDTLSATVTSLTTERDTLSATVTSLTTERDNLQAENTRKAPKSPR